MLDLVRLRRDDRYSVYVLFYSRLPVETCHEACAVNCDGVARWAGTVLYRGSAFEVALCDDHKAELAAFGRTASDKPIPRIDFYRRWIPTRTAMRLLGMTQAGVWMWAKKTGVLHRRGYYDAKAVHDEAKRRTDLSFGQRVALRQREKGVEVAAACGEGWIPSWKAREMLGIRTWGGLTRWAKRRGAQRRQDLGLVWLADVQADLQRRQGASA